MSEELRVYITWHLDLTTQPSEPAKVYADYITKQYLDTPKAVRPQRIDVDIAGVGWVLYELLEARSLPVMKVFPAGCRKAPEAQI